MKKLVYAFLALAFLMPGFASAKTQLEKVREKAYKTKLKEYKKEGWKSMSSKPMDLVLLEHYDKLAKLGDDGKEYDGTASRVKSKNVGQQMAANNAITKYARLAGSTLQGRVVADMSGNASDATGEFDNFYAAYESLVEKEMKGELEPSFTIYRDNGDGTIEVQSFFIVQESAAQKARLRALEEAMKNSQVAADHAQKISDFVRQGIGD